MSCEASDQVQAYFKSRGYEVMLFEGDKTYPAVKNHPDLYMFYDKGLICDPSVKVDVHQTHGPSIGPSYPANVTYNFAKLGSYIIGLEAALCQVMRDHMDKMGYDLIAVNQGYAKCSVGIVDDRSLITSDKGIYKACQARGLDVLLIQPGHIHLPGLDYGFIGGTCVRVGQDMFFAGAIEDHPDYIAIRDFLEVRGLNCVGTQEPLRDLGSFILIESVII